MELPRCPSAGHRSRTPPPRPPHFAHYGVSAKSGRDRLADNRSRNGGAIDVDHHAGSRPGAAEYVDDRSPCAKTVAEPGDPARCRVFRPGGSRCGHRAGVARILDDLLRVPRVAARPGGPCGRSLGVRWFPPGDGPGAARRVVARIAPGVPDSAGGGDGAGTARGRRRSDRLPRRGGAARTGGGGGGHHRASAVRRQCHGAPAR